MILELREIHTYYGLGHILQGVSLHIKEGEVVALLGRNGAGKTTTLRSIVGLTPPRRGNVLYKGGDIVRLPPYRICRRGIALVPETRGIFSYLTAEENLTIALNRRSRWGLDQVFRRFPHLQALRGRRGRYLSGGEQQMLAIARALVTGPELLLLDEPSQGLAPLVVETVMDTIEDIRREGVSILLVEQSVAMAMALADRHYVLDQGRIVFHGSTADLRARPEVLERYLGVTQT